MAMELAKTYQGNDSLTYENRGVISLARLNEGDSGVILESPDHSLLASLGFREGKEVFVTTKEIMQGPLICNIDGRNVAVGQEVARDIVIQCR